MLKCTSIFDGILGQYNFCLVETLIIRMTRRSLDLRNMGVVEQVLVKLYSACRAINFQRKMCFHFIYCSILKACRIRKAHVN